MKRNLYSNFDPIDWDNSHIYQKNFFNDWEWIKLTNFLNQQETQITWILNYSIKKNVKYSKTRLFKIPYQEISEKVGMTKNTVRKKLNSLKDKRILTMTGPSAWAWDMEGIRNLLSPKKEIIVTRIKPCFQPINPITDPLFEGLDLSQTF